MTACGTLAFNGNTSQTATGNSQFCTLEINNANAVNLTGENTVTQELRFTNGKLILQAGDLILETGATITGNGANKYVQTQNNASTSGFLVQEVNSMNGEVLFPIGNSSYNPVALENMGTTRYFFARVFDDVLANGTSDNNIENDEEVNKSWEIAPDDTGVNATVTVQWNAAEQGATFTASEAGLSKNSGSDWGNLDEFCCQRHESL